MGRPAKLVGPRSASPPLEVDAEALPPPAAGFTRQDTRALVAAALLHAMLIALFLQPDRRLGIGGLDLDAIGVEIVTVAPALEARSTARGRDAAGANRQVAEHNGDTDPSAAETAARDSRVDDVPEPKAAAATTADLVMRDWIEPPQPVAAAAVDPVIAPRQGDGSAPEQPDRTQPSPTDVPSAASDSRSAIEVLARFRGGAAARGREPTNTAAVVMAAARAGLRNEFQIELFKAIMANALLRRPGASGEVTVQFVVLRTGAVGDVRVIRSSGNSQLDESVVTAVRSTRVRPPPAELDEAALSFDIPVTYQ